MMRPFPSRTTKMTARRSLKVWAALAVANILLGGTVVFWSLMKPDLNGGPGSGKPAHTEEVVDLAPSPKRIMTPQEKKVKAAVDRGVGYLRNRLASDSPFLSNGAANHPDSRTGIQALMGLALLEAGVPPGDPLIRKVLVETRKSRTTTGTTYVLGTTLFFLNRLKEADNLEKEDHALVRSLALRLLAGQTASGLWSYYNPTLTPETEGKLQEALAAGTHRPNHVGGSYHSTSMTQFALLALWGSRWTGVPVRDSLLKAAAHFHDHQLPNGSWGYREGIEPFDSNTCAGLLALAMEEALLHDPEFRNKPATVKRDRTKVESMRRKAIAFLGPVIGQDPKKPHHPYSGYSGMGRLIGASANGDCYFLWCLERMAVIYGLKLVEGQDWYLWGSEVLVQAQAADGSWTDGYDPAIDTAFALLFLRRANLAKDLTDKLRDLGVFPSNALSPSSPSPARYP